MDDYYIDVGKRIKRYRAKANLSQEQLAEKANISKNYLSNLERGISKGRLYVYHSVAEALGISLDTLTHDMLTSNPNPDITSYFERVDTLTQYQKNMLDEFIDLLTKYNVDKNNNAGK